MMSNSSGVFRGVVWIPTHDPNSINLISLVRVDLDTASVLSVCHYGLF